MGRAAFTRAAGWIGRRSAIKWGRTASQFAKGADIGAIGRALFATSGFGTGAAKSIVGTGIKAGGGIFSQMYRHPYSSTAIGATGVSLYGVGRGVVGSAQRLQPQPIAYRRAAPMSGPGYNTWGRGERGLSASNIGASGDLTLGLHKTRHRI